MSLPDKKTLMLYASPLIFFILVYIVSRKFSVSFLLTIGFSVIAFVIKQSMVNIPCNAAMGKGLTSNQCSTSQYCNVTGSETATGTCKKRNGCIYDVTRDTATNNRLTTLCDKQTKKDACNAAKDKEFTTKPCQYVNNKCIPRAPKKRLCQLQLNQTDCKSANCTWVEPTVDNDSHCINTCWADDSSKPRPDINLGIVDGSLWGVKDSKGNNMYEVLCTKMPRGWEGTDPNAPPQFTCTSQNTSAPTAEWITGNPTDGYLKPKQQAKGTLNGNVITWVWSTNNKKLDSTWTSYSDQVQCVDSSSVALPPHGCIKCAMKPPECHTCNAFPMDMAAQYNLKYKVTDKKSDTFRDGIPIYQNSPFNNSMITSRSGNTINSYIDAQCSDGYGSWETSNIPLQITKNPTQNPTGTIYNIDGTASPTMQSDININGNLGSMSATDRSKSKWVPGSAFPAGINKGCLNTNQKNIKNNGCTRDGNFSYNCLDCRFIKDSQPSNGKAARAWNISTDKDANAEWHTAYMVPTKATGVCSALADIDSRTGQQKASVFMPQCEKLNLNPTDSLSTNNKCLPGFTDCPMPKGLENKTGVCVSRTADSSKNTTTDIGLVNYIGTGTFNTFATADTGTGPKDNPANTNWIGDWTDANENANIFFTFPAKTFPKGTYQPQAGDLVTFPALKKVGSADKEDKTCVVNSFDPQLGYSEQFLELKQLYDTMEPLLDASKALTVTFKRFSAENGDEDPSTCNQFDNKDTCNEDVDCVWLERSRCGCAIPSPINVNYTTDSSNLITKLGPKQDRMYTSAKETCDAGKIRVKLATTSPVADAVCVDRWLRCGTKGCEKTTECTNTTKQEFGNTCYAPDNRAHGDEKDQLTQCPVYYKDMGYKQWYRFLSPNLWTRECQAIEV